MSETNSTITPAEAKTFTGEDLVVVADIYVDPGRGAAALHADQAGPSVELDILHPELRDNAIWPEDIGHEQGQRLRCQVCGQPLLYASEAVHKPTNRGLFIGRECAHQIHGLTGLSTLDMKRLKQRLHTRQRFHKLVKDRPRLAPVIEWARGSESHYIARDIVSRFGEGRKLSFKQWRLLAKLHRGSLERAKREAQWAEEKASAPALVEGRQEIEGVILKVDERETDWGWVQKITLKMDNANVVWGSLPSAISNCDKGDRVAFTATVQLSDKDEHFGFFKRPSKARVIQPAPAVDDH